MNKSIIALALGLTVMISSCTKESIRPSGNIITQDGPSDTFNQLDVGSAFDVFVTYSATENSVVIKADDNIMPHIEVRGSGNSLDIGLDNAVNIKSNAVMEVYVTSSDMHSFTASGASTIRLMNELPNIESIDLSGASELEGTVISTDLDIELSGASEIEIDGLSDYTHIHLSGASEMADTGFETLILDADLSGASEARLSVVDELSIDASGASTLYYSGDPVILSQQLSGASEIVKL